MGGVIWLRGEKRAGQFIMLGGLVWGVVAYMVVRPFFAPDLTSDAVRVSATAGSYFDYYFGEFSQPLSRFANALVVYAPAVLFLGWRSPLWLLPATSIILPVLFSSGPGPSYDFRYHHYAIAIPFLMVAVVYGVEKIKSREGDQEPGRPRWCYAWYRYTIYTLLVTAIISIAVVDTPLSPFFYLAPPGSGRGIDATGYGVTDRDHLRRDWLDKTIPEEAAVAADRLSALHLTNRRQLYLTHMLHATTLEELLPDLDYVVTDALFDYGLGVGDQLYDEGIATDWATIHLLMENPNFVLEESRDGLLRFGRSATGLSQLIDEISESTSNYEFLFDDAIALAGVEISHLDGRLYSASYDWIALEPLEDYRNLIAVSRLEGVSNVRIVHLPTLAMMPTDQWPADTIIRESFKYTIPEDFPPGNYPLLVGWYKADHLLAADTDERSRVGPEYRVTIINVE
jgi:hypothetical protein